MKKEKELGIMRGDETRQSCRKLEQVIFTL